MIVNDVHPTANGGGPYNGVQGQPLLVSAAASRAGSPADPLSLITWSWGDDTASLSGTPAQVTQAQHTYVSDGQFEADEKPGTAAKALMGGNPGAGTEPPTKPNPLAPGCMPPPPVPDPKAKAKAKAGSAKKEAIGFFIQFSLITCPLYFV